MDGLPEINALSNGTIPDPYGLPSPKIEGYPHSKPQSKIAEKLVHIDK